MSSMTNNSSSHCVIAERNSIIIIILTYLVRCKENLIGKIVYKWLYPRVVLYVNRGNNKITNNIIA